MDDHRQPGREAVGLGGPVAHHGRWGHHQGGAGLALGQQVRQQRRGLAQAHVEGQTAAQAGLVQEVEPGQGVGLVGAQLAHEAVGGVHGFASHPFGLGQQVGGPARTGDGQPTRERVALQAEGVAQQLGPRHAGGGLPFGQGGGCRGQIGVIDLDPVAMGPHQRTGLGGQAGDLGRIELDVVEQDRPAHVGQLVRADHRRGGRVGLEAQGGLGPAGGQHGHPDVEAGGGQASTQTRHQLPCLVLAEDDLTPAVAARS